MCLKTIGDTFFLNMWFVIKRGHRGEIRRKILRCQFLKYIYIYIYIIYMHIWNLNFTQNLISTIWVYNKTYYFYVYIPWIEMFLEFINIRYSPSATFIPLLFYQPLPFLDKKCTLPHFLKNKQNSNPHPFCKVGEIRLWLIKTTCFTYLLPKIDPVII